ncbi:MAG: hypothetical protein JRG96_01855 [Deltaproteobacteria bacterium]|nr:hypothetical protein [Deltaproteobacteria bacterium]MBW2417834.1 hypothetical protein [Deltaproteobacteria bacterium]
MALCTLGRLDDAPHPRSTRDHPTWGEDKIDEELRVKFGISHSTSTRRIVLCNVTESPTLDWMKI